MASAPDPKTDSRLTVQDPSDAPEMMHVRTGSAKILKHAVYSSVMTSELLHGECVWVHNEIEDYAFVQSVRDRYTGWVLKHHLQPGAIRTTDTITALRTIPFVAPDLKSVSMSTLSLGAQIIRVEEDTKFVRDELSGWIPTQHVAPREVVNVINDPAAIAKRFVGTPYLWGGRTSLGIDCSGLTVAAFGACGVLLPRDSDMQFAWSGSEITDWSQPGALRRSDLVFWKGHVGIMMDSETLVHSNAYHMATAREPLPGAIERIAKHYGEPIGARRIDLAEGRKRPNWMDV